MKAGPGKGRDCDSILGSLHDSVLVWWQASSRTEMERAADDIGVTLKELGLRFPFEATRSNFDGMVRWVKDDFPQGTYLKNKEAHLDFDRLMKRQIR